MNTILRRIELKVPPVVIFVVSLVATAYLSQLQLLPLPYPLRPLGILLFFCGAMVGVAGVLAFRKKRTTVNPHAPHKASSLVNSGIFAYTRNPMYLGLVIGVIGSAFIVRDAIGFIFALLTFAYLQRFQIIPEERIMLELFGEEFKDYCALTKRWFGRY